jgi:enediyne biosynthesis protein E4
MQTETGEFAETGKESGVINTGYGISPITADFNNDGYPDLVHINIAGKSKAFINNGGDANYLKIKLPDTIASVAAKIMVMRSDHIVTVFSR